MYYVVEATLIGCLQLQAYNTQSWFSSISTARGRQHTISWDPWQTRWLSNSPTCFLSLPPYLYNDVDSHYARLLLEIGTRPVSSALYLNMLHPSILCFSIDEFHFPQWNQVSLLDFTWNLHQNSLYACYLEPLIFSQFIIILRKYAWFYKL